MYRPTEPVGRLTGEQPSVNDLIAREHRVPEVGEIEDDRGNGLEPGSRPDLGGLPPTEDHDELRLAVAQRAHVLEHHAEPLGTARVGTGSAASATACVSGIASGTSRPPCPPGLFIATTLRIDADGAGRRAMSSAVSNQPSGTSIRRLAMHHRRA